MGRPEPRMVNASMEEAFERAISSHIKGDIDYAKYVCQRILQVDPSNAIARYHLRLIEDWRSLPVMLRNLVVPHITAEAPVIFDVGAHLGLTVDAYRDLFPNAEIHAFEPDPELAAQLAEHCAGDSRVIVNTLAVGAVPGRMSFNICRAGGNSAIGSFLDINPKNETVQNLGAERVRTMEVEVTTLDAYCRERGIGHVDFVKIDVQGFEDKVLEGAAELLGRGAVTVFQVELLLSDMYSRTLSFYDIEKSLVPAGYRLHAVDDLYPRLGLGLFQLDAFYLSPSAMAAERERRLRETLGDTAS